MKKIFLFTGMLLAFGFTSVSQPAFQKVFIASAGWTPFDKPVGMSYCVNVTNEGGYIVGANPSQTCLGPATFIKLNAYGDTLWTRNYYFGGLADNVHSIEQTSDGGYIAGTSDGTNRILKTDTSGNLMWAKEYTGSSYHTVVHQTLDGGYIIAGDVGPGAGMGDGQLIRTNSTGDTIWTRSYGGAQGENFISVIQTTDGGYLATGRTRSYPISGTGYDGYAVKTNAAGDTLWTRVYGYSSINGIINAAIETSGGYVFQGQLDSVSYLIGTNSTGDVLWSKMYTDSLNSLFINGFIKTNDGGYAMTGSAFSPGTQLDVILLKTDSAGNYLWSQLYGDGGFDRGYSISQTQSGGFIISGAFFGFGCSFPQTGAYVILADSIGNSSCNNPGIAIMQMPATFVTGYGAITGSGCDVNTLAPTLANSYMITDSTLCIALGLADLNDHYNSALVYPNPADKNAVIVFDNKLLEEYTFTLYDSEGRLSRTIGNIRAEQIEIERKGIEPGLYFYRLISDKGTAFTGKMIFE